MLYREIVDSLVGFDSFLFKEISFASSNRCREKLNLTLYIYIYIYSLREQKAPARARQPRYMSRAFFKLAINHDKLIMPKVVSFCYYPLTYYY